MSMGNSIRARGSNRGGAGGGYERTEENYFGNKIRKLRAEYDALAPEWRQIFLDDLPKWDAALVRDRTREIPE